MPNREEGRTKTLRPGAGFRFLVLLLGPPTPVCTALALTRCCPGGSLFPHSPAVRKSGFVFLSAFDFDCGAVVVHYSIGLSGSQGRSNDRHTDLHMRDIVDPVVSHRVCWLSSLPA